MINHEGLHRALGKFKGAIPFDHCIVDDFFDLSTARALSEEFIPYDSDQWYVYKNAIEDKRALNNWNIFPPLTYRTFQFLNSRDFIAMLEPVVGQRLYRDDGLHGGGWHIHGPGGNLNPHWDYSIHPKMQLQRKLNIIVYLSEQLKPEDGGHLGLWAHDSKHNRPGKLIVDIEPRFNRAVVFDTTQNSWHGMSRPLTLSHNVLRKSLAVYYLCEPDVGADQRGRALFAARRDQIDDGEVSRLIKLRSGVDSSSNVYRTK